MPFESPPPSAADLSRRWRIILNEAREIVDMLPAPEVGNCILSQTGELLRASPQELKALLKAENVRFHSGCIRGAYPKFLFG